MIAPAPALDTRAASWLYVALVALPFLQALPVDFDRSGPLLLLLPALWAGRRALTEGLAELLHGSIGVRWLIIVGFAGLMAAVAFAEQPAPASVTAASWIILAAAAVIAGRIASGSPAARRQILAGVAVGAAMGMVAVWLIWLATGRERVPLYAHHRHLGLHMLAGAIASTGLILQPARQRLSRVTWWSVGAITWGGVLWSGGRAPMLALLGGLAVWYLHQAGDRRRLFRIVLLQFASGLALSALFMTSRPELGWWHAVERTSTAASALDANELTSTRSEFWRETILRASHAPWTGYGPDAYRFLTPKLDGQQPHNLILQLWLDTGLAGALPLLALLVVAWIRGCRAARRAGDASSGGWVALLTASVAAGMLDGVFYHLVAFLPAMLAAGVALQSCADPQDRPASRGVMAGKLVLGAALPMLLLHTWLFSRLASAPPPAPDAPTARAVRLFPSSTFGLWRWLDAWSSSHPDVALDWARWAQGRSASPQHFHVYAARILLVRGDRAGAVRELQAAREKVHWTVRPAIDQMLRDAEAAPRHGETSEPASHE